MVTLFLIELALPFTPWAPTVEAARPSRAVPSKVPEVARMDRPIELPERRTPRSQSYLNPDGTHSTEFYGKPVFYRDASGQYQAIQNTLVAEPDGQSIRNAANRYKVSFRRNSGPDFLGFEHGGRSLAMGLEGARVQPANWHGNKLTYAEVMPGVDLTYTVGDDFVKEEIVLKEPIPSPRFTFTLSLKGTRMERGESGSLLFWDSSTDDLVWTIPQMYMKDAVGNLSAGVAVESRVTGNKIRLEVIPDQAWLNDPNRVYPVRIDPTIALRPDYVGGMDTTLADGEGFQDLNLGFDEALFVGSDYASLLKFDLSAIPRASSIESANLKLTYISDAPTVNSTGVPVPSTAPTLSVSAYTSGLAAGTYSVRYTYLTPQGETEGSPAGSIQVKDYQAIQVGLGSFPAGVTGAKIYMGMPGQERLVTTTDLVEATLTAPPSANAPGIPVVPSNAPTLSVSTRSASIAAGTYSVRYTYVRAGVETRGSPEATITLPGSRGVEVNVGPLPTGVNEVRLYFGPQGDERFVTKATQSTATLTTLPGVGAGGPPESNVGYVPAPTSAMTLSEVVAPAGTSGFLAGSYFVRYTYLNAMGETSASPPQAVSISDGKALQVRLGTMPRGVTAANIYVGTTSEGAQKVGSVPASAAGSPFTFGSPPAALFTPSPGQALAFLANPTGAPRVETLAGNSPFVDGPIEVAYTWFAPNGESAASPVTTVTLRAGDVLKVTAPQAVPADATGMRVYLGNPGGPLYRVGTLYATRGDSSLPIFEVKTPLGYQPIQPVSSSTYSTPSFPGLRAVDLTTSTRLEGAQYFVSYSWVYPDQETRAGNTLSITIKDGQGIEVVGASLPPGALGMRVYMGRSSLNLWLAATSMGNRTVIQGDPLAPVAPAVNSTALPAPAVEAITLSALPPGTYHVAYTLTTETGESAPSPVEQITVAAGQRVDVFLAELPVGTGANVYIGTSASNMQLVRGVTGQYFEITGPPSGDAPPISQATRGEAPPATPATAPTLRAVTTSTLPPGTTLSVRYAAKSQFGTYASSTSTTATVAIGQALSIRLPDRIPGIEYLDLYVGPPGAERAYGTYFAGRSVVVTALQSSPLKPPEEGRYIPGRPTVNTASGGTLTGDVYFSYSYYHSSSGESPRSPEVVQAFSGTNRTAVLTTDVMPFGGAVRVYVGRSPGEAIFYRAVSASAGSRATISIDRMVPAGIAVHAVTTPWTELDATWLRSGANALWVNRGGDFRPDSGAVLKTNNTSLTADLTTLVRQWADGSVPNQGIILTGVGARVGFASSDHPTESLRPVLTIKYREKKGAPRVYLTQPASGSSVSGLVTLSAAVTVPDPGTTIDRVDFYVNGAQVGSSTTAPYSVTWNTANLPGGQYEVTAKAYDQWGQEGTSNWSMVFSDSFDDLTGLAGHSAKPDTELGIVTLPVVQKAIAVQQSGASSEKAAEAYPADHLLDGKSETYWRSPGQLTPNGYDSVLFDLNSTRSVSLTVSPQNAKDGLTVKAQAIASDGTMLRESAVVVLDSSSKTVSVSATSNFTSVRLVFSNLRRDLASGRYHAEVKEVSGGGLKLAGGESYRATYEASNAVDGSQVTSWVSAGQASPTAQVYLDLHLRAGANAFYIKPRTPGVSATIAVYRGQQGGWEPVLSIASLDEGVYPLPPGVTPDRVRIYLTNLIGMTGPGAPSTYFGGIDEVIPYEIELLRQEATVTARSVTLPAPARRFLLEVVDSQPPGSSIQYQLYDGITWHAITPGVDLTLPAGVSLVQVRAILTSASPMAIPSLSSWRLYTFGAHPFELLSGVDTIPPTAEVVYPVDEWLSGQASLNVATWDNVGVTKVELYVDTDLAPVVTATKAPDDPTPYTLTLDTTKLSPGKHMVWARAYDAAGNVSGSLPPTTTYDTARDLFDNRNGIDEELSSYPQVVSGAVRAGTTPLSFSLTGAGTLTQTFNAGLGWMEVTAPAVDDSSGTCAAGSIALKVGSTVVASDQIMAGECRELRLAYLSTTASSSYNVTIAQSSSQSYTARVEYHGVLATAAPYTTSSVISTPTVTAGPLTGVTLKVSEVKPSGTNIRYYASANDGVTWQAVTPGTYAKFNHGGSKLRLRADLIPATGSGSTYANVTPELRDWTAEVTQFIPRKMLAVSQIAPPHGLTASLSGTSAALTWQASATPGVTYNLYRSTTPHPTGEAYLVATGLTGTTLVESSNLLKNSSFEKSLASWNYTGIRPVLDTNDATAGLRSMLFDQASVTVSTAYQDVALSAPAGTTFTLSTRVKGWNVVESNPQSLGIRLTYTDNTRSESWGSLPGGTFDWTTSNVSVTATKPVKAVQVNLRLNGRGKLWFDAVQLDTQGATIWNDGDLEASKVYYYLLTAIDANGLESAPSNEASTGTKLVTTGMVGLKGFWSYAGVDLPGGNGYVNVASGNLVYAATDLVYPGRLLATVFRRVYNHQRASVAGAMGYGWDHNLNWVLSPGSDGVMILKEGDGSTFTFNPGGDGVNYTSPPGAHMRLVKGADGAHTLVRHDNNLLYQFDAQGRLLRLAESNGNALTLTYDSKGRLSQVTDPAGKAITFAYSEAGYLIRTTHPGHSSEQPRQVIYEYDHAGNLAQVIDLEGNSIYYGYDEHNRLIQITDALGHSVQVAYSGMPGVVERVLYADGADQSFTYGATGDQTGWTKSTVTDARGFTFTYQVDAAGLLKKQSFPYGSSTPAGSQTGTVTVEHDADWNVTRYIDPNGGVYEITYDGFGKTLSVTDPLKSTTWNNWTLKPYPGAAGQHLVVPAQTRDALGNTTTITTDDWGNVTHIEDPLLQVIEYTYDRTGLLTSNRDANGHITYYTYDANGWLLAQTDPMGGTVRYTYQVDGNPSAVTDAAGNTTRYRYDRLGRLLDVTHADGSRQFNLFDGVGNLIQSTDPGGLISRYEYDIRNRLVRTHSWPNAGDQTIRYTTRYEYDSVGQLSVMEDAREKQTTYKYDGVGRQISATNPLNETHTFTYDAAGNMIRVTDPLGKSARAEYDVLHRRTKTIVPQSSSQNMTLAYSYDALGRLTSQKDELGSTTTYHYDSVGRLVFVVDPMGFGTTYTYDRVGNRLAVIDAQRRTTHYVYDAANRVIEEGRPDGVRVFHQYDQAGRRISHTNGRNQKIGYRYDNRNRLVEVTYPSGVNVRYSYDASGRRTSMTDWNGVTRYRYNLLGWLEQTEDPWGHEVSYTYDPAGNRTEMNLRYTGMDFRWTYQYDDAGRLTNLQSPTVARPNTLSYDKSGRLMKLVYANNDTVTHGYNDAGQLTSISSSSSAAGTVVRYNYAFDKAGRRTNIDRYGGVVGDVWYKYDANSRVTSAGPTSSATDREYYYDLVGNRHTQVVNTGDPKGIYTYVYDPVNRLIEEFGPLSSKEGGGRYHMSYSYDGDGSQTKVEKDGKEVTLYYYDEESRLTQVTNPLGQATRYTYDGDGKRLRLQDVTGTTVFVYDGNEVVAEIDPTGTLKVAYTRLPGGRLVSQWQGGETFWYHLDGLGSTMALTDESGKVRNRYGYDEYGNLQSGTTEEIFNRFTFTGQAWDGSVGLYHYKARYYNPQAGRFLTQDTWKGSAWTPWTQNLYTYVGNNPVNYVDPTGHAAQHVTIDDAAKTLSVTWSVLFSGDAATYENAIGLVQRIKKEWEGVYNGYQFTLDINWAIKEDGLAEGFKGDGMQLLSSSGISFVTSIGGSRGTVFLKDENGYAQDWQWVAAHEFGHYIGLTDHYWSKRDPDTGKRTGGPNPGWTSNMMAVHLGSVDTRNVIELLMFNGQHGKLTGSYGIFYDLFTGGVMAE